MRWSFQLNFFNSIQKDSKSKVKITPLSVAPAMLAGYFANNTLPARLGEVVKTLIWRKKSGMKASGVFGTLVIERVFDGLALVTMAIFTYFFVFVEQKDQKFTFAIFLSLAIFIGIIIFGIITVYFPKHTDKFIKKLTSFLPVKYSEKIYNIFHSFLESFKVLPNIKSVLVLYFLSLSLWLFEALTYYLTALAFTGGTGLHLSYFHYVFITAIGSLMTLIPSMPGFAGTFDFAIKLSLLRFGINNQSAQAYTLILHLVLWLPITLIGAFFFWKEGMFNKKIKTQSSSIKTN